MTRLSARIRTLQAFWSGSSDSQNLRCHFTFSRLLLTLSVAMSYSTATAKEGSSIESSTRFTSSSRSASTSSLSQEQLATLYGLDMKQWQAYQTVMQGPRGLWSPNLHPVAALGMREGISDTEFQQLATKMAKINYERVQRELAFEHATRAAGLKMYGHLPLFRDDLISVKDQASTHPSHSRQQYFVLPPCPECRATVQKMITDGQEVDIYINGDQQQIQRFAKSMGIPPLLVPGQISLNRMSKLKMSSFGIKQFPALRITTVQ